MAADIQGVIISEIFPGSSSSQNGYDVDGDGRSETNDEFVELFNTSKVAVDIGGWTIEDGDDSSFTFPTGTMIPAGGYVVLVGGWEGGVDNPLPSNFFDLGNNANNGFLKDSGEEVILSSGPETIAAVYGDFDSDDISGIPSGSVDNFGTPADAQSLQRNPADLNAFVTTTPTAGALNECFVTGTLISTKKGEVAVENLNVGDVVKTANGQLEAIKWIGRQTVKPENVQNPMRGYPILVKAGALGDGLPVRDLYVSPDHALFVDGLLINAGALVNSSSIVQTEPTETFTYFHVELEKHALLIAEGTYAESYLPQREDRDCYDNADEYTDLYPEGPSVMLWPMDYPRVSSYTTVPRYVRKRLQTVADDLYGAVVLQTA